MSSSRSSSSWAWEIAVSGSPWEETIFDNVKEKRNIEGAAEEFIRTFRNDLKMQRLKSLAEASAAAAAADQFKQKNSSSEIRSNRENNLSNIQKFEKIMDVDKSAADFCWNINSNCRAAAASRNRRLTKESVYSRHRHKCLFTVCLFEFPKEEEDQIWALHHNCSPNSIKEEAWPRRKVPASSQPQHLSVLGFSTTDSRNTAKDQICSLCAAETLSES